MATPPALGRGLPALWIERPLLHPCAHAVADRHGSKNSCRDLKRSWRAHPTGLGSAAMMLKGLTAQYLIRQTYRVKAGDTILFHAAAGGVGLIACQWAKHLGATVIGTVGSDEKAKLAKAHGCAHTIVYTREDFVKRVDEITE